MTKKLKTAVLISGNGTNLQALIDACATPGFPAEICLVFSNKADAYGLERAKKAGIPTCVLSHKEFETREAFDEAMHEKIVESGAEFICMAGFMRLLTTGFTEKWHDKLINIHPSLLPAFKGLNVQQAAIDAGVKFSGCTVHFVRPAMDSGPILVQAVVPVYGSDTAEILSKRILKQEHVCYPLALRLVAEGRVSIRHEVVHVKGEKPMDSVLLNPPSTL